MAYNILDVILIVFFALMLLTLISVTLLVFTPGNDKNLKEEEKNKIIQRNRSRRIEEIGAKAAANFITSNNYD